MFGPSAGAFGVAAIQEQTRLEGVRRQNAQAWQEFRRQNPTATLAEMSGFADSIAGGDPWLRSHFPAQDVLAGLAVENDRRRQNQQLEESARASEARERLTNAVQTSYARRLVELGPDRYQEAIDGTIQEFGGGNQSAADQTRQIITTMGSPDRVINFFTVQMVGQHGNAATAAARGGGPEAIRNLFGHLGPQAVRALTAHAEGVLRRERLEEEYTQARIDSTRAGTDRTRLDTQTAALLQPHQVQQAQAQAQNATAQLPINLREDLQQDPAFPAMVAEDEDRARRDVRARAGAMGLQLTQEQEDAAIEQGVVRNGLNLRTRYQEALSRATQRVANMTDADMRRDYSQRALAVAGGHVGSLGERDKARVAGTLNAITATAYLNDEQIVRVARFLAGNPSATPEQALAQAGSTMSIAQANEQIRQSAINAQMAGIPVPRTSDEYVRIANGAIDENRRRFQADLARVQADPNGAALFERFVAQAEANIATDRAALERQFNTRGTWATTRFTQQQRDLIEARLNVWQELVTNARNAGFQSSRQPLAATSEPAPPAQTAQAAQPARPAAPARAVTDPDAALRAALLEMQANGQITPQQFQRQLAAMGNTAQPRMAQAQQAANGRLPVARTDLLASSDNPRLLAAAAAEVRALLATGQNPVAAFNAVAQSYGIPPEQLTRALRSSVAPAQ